jgi:hypothetical protein
MYVCSNEWEALAKTLASLPCSSSASARPLFGQGSAPRRFGVDSSSWSSVLDSSVYACGSCAGWREDRHTLVITRVQVAVTEDADRIARSEGKA